MIELEAFIRRIEATKISGIRKVTVHGAKMPNRMEVELPERLLKFQEGQAVKAMLSKEPITSESDLYAEGLVFLIKPLNGSIIKIYASIGGLQLRIELPQESNIFKPKDKIYLAFKSL